MFLVTKNNRGQSLVSVLIGLGIATIMMTSIMAAMEYGQKGQNQIKYRIDADNFNEEIRALLGSRAACTNTFKDLTADIGADNSLTDIRDGSTAPGATVYSVDSVHGDRSVRLASLNLNNFAAGPNSTTGTMTLVVGLTSQKNTLGPSMIARTVNLSLDIDAGTKKIVSCVAMSKMLDSIWQRSAVNSGDIFFVGPPTGGKVGIGTTSPSDLLDVNGSIGIGSSFENVTAYVNSTGAYTIPNTDVNIRRITLTANAIITLPTYTATLPTRKTYSLTLFLKQDAIGGRTVTFAGSGGDTIIWDLGLPPAISSSPNKITIIQLIKPSDETMWYGMAVWKN